MQDASRPGIVVSGIGATTAYGTGWERTVEGLRAGRPALGRPEPAPEGLGSVPVGVWDDPSAFEREFPELQPPFPVRETKMVLVASRLALRDAALGDDQPRDDIGVMLDRTWGPGNAVVKLVEGILDAGPRKASPVLFSQSVPNAATGHVVRRLGVRGPHLVTMGGGAAALAVLALRSGDASAVLTGGFAEIHPDRIQAERAWSETTTPAGPQLAYGEGAVIVVLEREDRAAERGHPAKARLAGFAVGTCGNEAQRGTILGSCIQEALSQAGLGPDDVQHVVGSGARADQAEPVEQEALAGAGLPGARPFTLKPLLGETLGMAAGASIAWAATDVRAPTLVLDASRNGSLLAALVCPS